MPSQCLVPLCWAPRFKEENVSDVLSASVGLANGFFIKLQNTFSRKIPSRGSTFKTCHLVNMKNY